MIGVCVICAYSYRDAAARIHETQYKRPFGLNLFYYVIKYCVCNLLVEHSSIPETAQEKFQGLGFKAFL